MYKKIFYFFAIASFFFQCTGNLSPEFLENEDEKILNLSMAEKQVVKSSNQFGLTLFKQVVSTGGDSNIFISPLSVSMALGMTLNGANGSTYDAMQSTLELKGLTEQEINLSYQNLIKVLVQLDPKVIFEIANSIWYRMGFQVENAFIDINKQFFNAEVTELDFSQPSAIDIINQWVDDKTHGKIEQIIDYISATTVMFLINAIYFKGTWSYEFDHELTSDAKFYLPDGTETLCKMMQQKWEYLYLETDDFQAIDLPYGEGNFRMTIFLPQADEDIDAFINEMNPTNWDLWLSSFSKDSVNLFLPKFKVEYKLKMNDVLSHLGMGIAFSASHADFSRIRSSGGLWIDKVLHKTYVEVNEEGTEAAAVTVVEMRELSTGDDPEVYMIVDRPFIFTIRENSSNTIIFMGKIMQPEWQGSN